MDPRPYHFDYRRPRLANPTYLSRELTDRLQQQAKHAQKPASPIHSSQNPKLKRANSTDINSKSSKTDILTSNYSRGSIGSSQKINNSMANYGRNLLGTSRYEQEEIFKRQDRNFNIISYYPRAVRPNLREFPKLTMEDRLLQRSISSLQ